MIFRISGSKLTYPLGGPPGRAKKKGREPPDGPDAWQLAGCPPELILPLAGCLHHRYDAGTDHRRQVAPALGH
jgi:hypothetical protein